MSHDSAVITAPATPATIRIGRSRRNLLALVAVAIATVVAGATGFLLDLRTQSLAAAEERTRAGTRLLEEHFHRVFRATGVILARGEGILGDRAFDDDVRQDHALWKEMAALAAGLPEIGHLVLVDAAGMRVLTTRDRDAPPLDFSDRAYFQALSAGGELYISPLIAMRSAQGHSFQIARALRRPDGSLRGVLLANFEADSYTEFLTGLQLGAGGVVGIFDAQGRVILRQPQLDSMKPGASIANGPVLTAATTTPRGTMTASSPLDGTDRILSYAALSDPSVIVLCGMSRDEALANWRATVAVTLSLVLVATLGMALLGGLAYRGLLREEALVHGLEEEVAERTRDASQKAGEAQAANESKTRYLAAASHDLRQPMQAAGMFVEVLAHRLAGAPEYDIVDKLRQCVEATQTLLTTLLDASTLEAGRVQANIKDFPLAPMMANLADQLFPEVERAGLDLRVVPSGAIVRSDPVLLERLLRNLLHNAVRYTPKGKVLLGCRHRGELVEICVVDTGIGIPADKLEAIFDDFTRLGDKGAGAQRGLGLGLGVARRMADLLGHRIHVRSVPGKGSCFVVIVDKD